MPAGPSPKRICGRIGLALFAMLMVWYGATIALQWWVAQYARGLLLNPWLLWLLNSGPLFLLGMPVFLLVMRTLPDGPTILRWKLPFGAREYALAMLFCLGASRLIAAVGAFVVLLVQGFWGGGELVVAPVQEMLFAGGILPSIVFGVVVPAIGEEFIFRYMIRRKMRGCPDSTYLFFSGLCFALFHGNITQGLYTFVLGAIFAWAYVMTGKFLVPVSMHFLLNLIGILPGFAVASRSAVILIGLLTLGIIAGGIIVFFACKRNFVASLQPPAVAEWPHRPMRPRRTASSAYAEWYAANARGSMANVPFQLPAHCPPMMRHGARSEHSLRLVFRSVGMWLFIGASLLLVLTNLTIWLVSIAASAG